MRKGQYQEQKLQICEDYWSWRLIGAERVDTRRKHGLRGNIGVQFSLTRKNSKEPGDGGRSRGTEGGGPTTEQNRGGVRRGGPTTEQNRGGVRRGGPTTEQNRGGETTRRANYRTEQRRRTTRRANYRTEQRRRNDEAGQLPNRTEAAYDDAGQLPNRTEAAYDEAGQLPNRTEAAKRRGRRNRCRTQRRCEDCAKREVRKTEETDRLREEAIDGEKCERTTTKAVTQNKDWSASTLYSGNYGEEQHGQGNHHPFTAGTTRKNNMDKGINTPLQREL